MDDTVCLTQSTTASFTCVVDRRGVPITTANWHILDGGRYFSVTGRDRHMVNPIINNDIITDTLTVSNLSVDDNGTQYRCQPDDGIISMSATLTVLGMCSYLRNVCNYQLACILTCICTCAIYFNVCLTCAVLHVYGIPKTD